MAVIEVVGEADVGSPGAVGPGDLGPGAVGPGAVGPGADPVTTGARRVEQARRRIEGELISWLLEVERSGVMAESGYADVAAWGRGELRWCPVEARSRRGLVGLARRVPAVVEWLLEGRLGVAQAHLLGRLFRAPRVGRFVPEFIASFLRYAVELDDAGFEQYCRAWQSLMDQDGSCPDGRRRSAHRAFVDHEFRLTMTGPTADGLAWDAMLRRFEELEWQADWAQARQCHGDAATADLLARTPAQRRYDALQNLLAHVVLPAMPGGGRHEIGDEMGDVDDADALDDAGALDGADAFEDAGDRERACGAVASPGGRWCDCGRSARPPVTTVVNLVADLPTWLHALDQVMGIPGVQPWVEPFGPRRGRSETVDGVQVHPRDVVLASLVGRVRAVVLDAAGRPVQMSSAQRLFRGAMADAVRMTASRCTHPGCLVPVSQAQVDHLDPHAHGGVTAVDNGGIACGRHNSWRYTAQARTTLRDDGVWVTHTHDGRRIAPPD